MKEEQDLYRIVLSNDEKKDIEILNSIRNKLVKPRVLDMLIWTTFFRDKAKEKLLFILPQKETTGVYKLTNIKNQKVYIGQAVNIYDRIFTHLKHGLHIDCPAGNKLYDAMHKDGIQNFTIELLEECKPEELNEKEKYFISLYNAVDWGYNKTIGNN